jgi:hypothetical protein
MATLAQIIEACEFRTGFKDSAYRARWVEFVNKSIREYSRRQPWEGLEDTITLTANGTKYLYLPHYVDTIVHLINKTLRLPVNREGDWDREATAVYVDGTVGSTIAYDKIGTVAALADPSGYLVLQSTHASDLQSICFNGIASNSGASGTGLADRVSTVSVACTGTSPVTVSTLFTRVISVSKVTNSNGDFFVFDAGASLRHLAYINRYESDSHFKRLQLLYVPAAGTLFELRFRYKVPPVFLDEQSPHPSIPFDYLVSETIATHHREREQDQKAALVSNEATRLLEGEAHKETNFDEPYSRIIPQTYVDPDSPDAYGVSW